MNITVKLNNLRVSPRKVRQVVDLVRGKRAAEAQSILLFTVNKSARPVLKLLNSAIASAKHDLHLDESNLFISKITVDEGPKLKRWHPMSRGRAYPIIKRSSHIALVLSEKNLIAKKEEMKEKVEEKPKTKNRRPLNSAELQRAKSSGYKTQIKNKKTKSKKA